MDEQCLVLVGSYEIIELLFVSFGGDHWALHRLLIGRLGQVTLALVGASSEGRALHQCMSFDQLRKGSHWKINVKLRQGGLF
jgi:hypothetical protein